MMESLVVALREGAEAALIIGIVLAYLHHIQRPDLRSSVFVGLATAVVASLIGVWYLDRLPWGEETVEGVVMIVAALLITTMVIWMWRVAKHLRRQIEGQVDSLARRSRFAWPGLFALVFLMVFREGAETVLMLHALTLKTGGVSTLIGALIGLALAVSVGVLFFRGTWRIDLAAFFRISGIVLFVVAGQLAIKGVHELHEGGAVALGHVLEEATELLTKSGATSFLTVLTVAAALITWEWWKRRRQAGLESVTKARK